MGVNCPKILRSTWAPDPPESRWWGYSVGKWVDDYTFVAESNGFDDRTWLDNVGRPHSDLLHVTEQYRRTNRDHLEITVTVDDPKMYTKPWVALRLTERLQKPISIFMRWNARRWRRTHTTKILPIPLSANSCAAQKPRPCHAASSSSRIHDAIRLRSTSS